jgi:hypothetical protein
VLLVVQNSGSMSDEQVVLAGFAQELVSQLAAPPFDWRVAVAYTDMHLAPSPDPASDTCAGSAGPGRRRLCPFTADAGTVRNGVSACAYARPGTCGSGSERAFTGAQVALQRFLAGSGCEAVPGAACALRPGVPLFVIFLGDTGEQSVSPPPGQPDNSVESWSRYLADFDPVAPGAQAATAHGMRCPLRPQPGDTAGPCSDDDVVAARYDRFSLLVRAGIGVEGSIRSADQAQIRSTVAAILARLSEAIFGDGFEAQTTR